MELRNYIGYLSGWAWTGRYTYNQLWSFFRVDEPINVSQIQIYWGGYRSSTRGRHFIAKIRNSTNAQDLRGNIVTSSEFHVPQGRSWRTANVRETYLEPGAYAVGIWRTYRDSCTVGEWRDNDGLVLHARSTKNIDRYVNGTRWKADGVLPCRLIGDSGGRMKVKSNGSWRDGNAYVKSNGSWRKATAVWVKSNGVWRKSK